MKHLDEAAEHAKQEFPREACGLFVRVEAVPVYFPCKNLAESSEHFILDPADYVRAEDAGEVFAVFHSHPNAHAKPSQADLVSCEASHMPWYIFALPSEEWKMITPSGYKAPLLGREFSYGVLDCLTLVRDWYRENRGVELPHFEHREGWWNRGQDLYMENFRKAGFEPTDGLEPGDVILMQILSPVANHAGVYLGNGLMLHHLMNRLSCREVYGGWYRKNTRRVIRYRGAS